MALVEAEYVYNTLKPIANYSGQLTLSPEHNYCVVKASHSITIADRKHSYTFVRSLLNKPGQPLRCSSMQVEWSSMGQCQLEYQVVSVPLKQIVTLPEVHRTIFDYSEVDTITAEEFNVSFYESK